MGVTYDTGALVAADRGERRMWARHRALLMRRDVPAVPAPVVAQSWRGTSRQALLARLLSGCDVEALDDGQARSVGALAARAATTDIVDACAGATWLSAPTKATSSPSHPPSAAASRSITPN